MFNQQVTVGQIGSVPVVLDGSFIILVLFYGSDWFLAGTAEALVMGLVVVAGGVGSILVHELAHAWAGRICRIGTTHIELNGMGGLCYLERAGDTREQQIFILLAGPASNLAIWATCYWALYWAAHLKYGGLPLEAAQAIYKTVWTIAQLNIAMAVFNLAPSFPLDGGRALVAWLTKRLDILTAIEVVTTLGWGVCAICVYLAFASQPIFMLLAVHLFLANREAMAVEGQRYWKRWD